MHSHAHEKAAAGPSPGEAGRQLGHPVSEGTQSQSLVSAPCPSPGLAGELWLKGQENTLISLISRVNLGAASLHGGLKRGTNSSFTKLPLNAFVNCYPGLGTFLVSDLVKLLNFLELLFGINHCKLAVRIK